MSGTQFDLVILGGGSGGYAAALRGAQLGLSVALIEKDKLGGTCLHYGCIPTKALLHAAEVADSARESEQFGVNATLEGIDVPKVNTYRDGVVARLYKGLQGLVKSRDITLVTGTGRLTSPTTVDVDGTTLKVNRQTEAGYDEVTCPLPALVSVTAGVVEPRYPSFKGIMAAKSKPVDTVTAADLGIDPVGWAGAGQEITEVGKAAERQAGEIIEDDGEGYAKIVSFLESKKVI